MPSDEVHFGFRVGPSLKLSTWPSEFQKVVERESGHAWGCSKASHSTRSTILVSARRRVVGMIIVHVGDLWLATQGKRGVEKCRERFLLKYDVKDVQRADGATESFRVAREARSTTEMREMRCMTGGVHKKKNELARPSESTRAAQVVRRWRYSPTSAWHSTLFFGGDPLCSVIRTPC